MMNLQRARFLIRPVGRSRTTRFSSTTKPPPAEKPNIFKEKTDRATQLHHELEDLVQNHYKRTREEQSRPIYHGFFEFIRKNKGEMMNVTAAFVCTLLAYQIVGLRKYGQRLERELQDKDDELRKKQVLLLTLTEPEFAQPIAEQFNYDIQASSSGSSWSRRQPDHSAALATSIQQALKKRIGDAGLSAAQKKDQIMIKLQQAQDELLVQEQQRQSSALKQEEPDIVEIWKKSTGEQVVKKRKFSI